MLANFSFGVHIRTTVMISLLFTQKGLDVLDELNHLLGCIEISASKKTHSQSMKVNCLEK